MGYSKAELMIRPPSLVSVVVPAFNEEESIPSCVKQLSEAMVRAGYEAEIIIVNDGSTDHTLDVAQSLQRSCPSLRVLDLGRNYGKAIALREGIRVAKGNIVALFDADAQYDPLDLVTLIALVSNGTDVANGRRDYASYQMTRTVFSLLYNKILEILFHVAVTDSNCGLKVLTRRAADPDALFRYGLPLMVPVLKVKGFGLTEATVSLRERKAGQSKYFREGSFLGGWRNIRDISYHSGMLLVFLASLPSELLRSKMKPAFPTNPWSQRYTERIDTKS